MTFLTEREAAEYLGVSLHTLRTMETEGSLIPFRALGGHCAYSRRMLNEYLGKSYEPPRQQESENESEGRDVSILAVPEIRDQSILPGRVASEAMTTVTPARISPTLRSDKKRSEDGKSVHELDLQNLWQATGFKPNPAQEEAIRHTDGPLYLPAGPGSGKTRVLLWRALNLIVFHGVPPDAIYLSTFTEKAALQLREGLQVLLGDVTNRTGQAYDLTQIYVGTVHSLCRRLIMDRRFSEGRQRIRPPQLLDELGQYFHLRKRRNWTELTANVGLDPDDDNVTIYRVFDPGFKYDSTSKHKPVVECMAFFNRLSEECVDPHSALDKIRAAAPELLAYFAQHDIDPDGLELLFRLCIQYRQSLSGRPYVSYTDFALLQQAAYDVLDGFSGSGHVFQHVIVDEYQDTNTIQERIFFKLAAGHKNICVVGDDDQALYRFRGATVENFVEFPHRCQQYLGQTPTTIPLTRNYRSRKRIVDFYTAFIEECDWRKRGRELYRVPKDIEAHRTDSAPSVIASTKGSIEGACAEIAQLVRRLLDTRKVENPNQIAFLFPTLKSKSVGHMREALNAQNLVVYAPRAGRFLEVPEAVDVFGIFAQIFGVPPHPKDWGGDFGDFCNWMDNAKHRGAELMDADPMLDQYVRDRREEIATGVADYEALTNVVERYHWDLRAPYNLNTMKRALHDAPGLSPRAKRIIGSRYLDRIIRKRIEEGNPFDLRYMITRATSMDWNVLDLFYRICGFQHFKHMFDLAQGGQDEGPIFNLALLSQYLTRFIDEYTPLISAEALQGGLFKRGFFMSYLLSLFRLGESEYEHPEDPFPKGRIPFITIHQAKGLEFPVVVLANPLRRKHKPRRVELFVYSFLEREPGEPLERMDEFDIMRLFYVALSRAKNLLVLADASRYTAKVFRDLFKNGVPRIPDLDLNTLPSASIKDEKLPQTFSYTADYLQYKKCARQYMIFRKYGFAPSRTQMMFFGSLVHQTLEDLHNHLIAQKEAQA